MELDPHRDTDHFMITDSMHTYWLYLERGLEVKLVESKSRENLWHDNESDTDMHH